jgi:hypothetical protein
MSVELLATFSVEAENGQDAVEKTKQALSNAESANLGAWPNGQPIVAEFSFLNEKDKFSFWNEKDESVDCQGEQETKIGDMK